MRLAVLADTAVACAIAAAAALIAFRLGLPPGSATWRWAGCCTVALALSAIALGVHRRDRGSDVVAIAGGVAVLVALVAM